LIDHFLVKPLEVDEGKNASDLLKRRVKRRKAPVEDAGNLTDAENTLSQQKTKRKPRKKRAAKDKDGSSSDESASEQETAKKRRAKRKAEVLASFKSAAFVDSDDDMQDEERDKLFFAQEQEARQKREVEMAEKGAVAVPPKKGGTKKRKSKAKDAEGPSKKKPRSSTPALESDGPSTTASTRIETPSDASEVIIKKPRRQIVLESDE
jgi:replication fork protection complex subunit Tof1/Swi1